MNTDAAFDTAIDTAYQLERDLPGFDATTVVADIEEADDLWRNAEAHEAIDFLRGCAEATILSQVRSLFTTLADAIDESR